jgi:uncharacterized phage protein (TIGR01671 family)
MGNILFRGKTKNNEWVYWNEYGELVSQSGKRKSKYAYERTKSCISYYYYIWQLKDSGILVKETISKCTLLKDGANKKIFEGDIIRYDGDLYIVKKECNTLGGYWAETGYILDHIGWSDYIHFTDTIDDYFCECQVIVVGNRFDNPELLEVKQ